jgi:hypothetical protein
MRRAHPAASEESDYRRTYRWAVAVIGCSVGRGVGDDFLTTYDSRT